MAERGLCLLYLDGNGMLNIREFLSVREFVDKEEKGQPEIPLGYKVIAAEFGGNCHDVWHGKDIRALLGYCRKRFCGAGGRYRSGRTARQKKENRAGMGRKKSWRLWRMTAGFFVDIRNSLSAAKQKKIPQIFWQRKKIWYL